MTDTARRIRVLVVDDSALVRKALSDALALDPELLARELAEELLGDPLDELEAADAAAADVAAAAARAEGSVHEALRLLDGDALAFDANIARLFDRLPQIDWLGVHMLADKLTGRDNEAAYETFMRALQRHIDRRVRTLAAAGTAPARLVGFARAWDDIRDLARETEVFNFDKKALALAIFDRLAGAERATR